MNKKWILLVLVSGNFVGSLVSNCDIKEEAKECCYGALTGGLVSVAGGAGFLLLSSYYPNDCVNNVALTTSGTVTLLVSSFIVKIMCDRKHYNKRRSHRPCNIKSV